MLYPEDHDPDATEYERRAVRRLAGPQAREERAMLRKTLLQILIVMALAVAAALILAGPLRAQSPARPGFDVESCKLLAGFVESVVNFRDAGANLPAHLNVIRRANKNTERWVLTIIEEETRRVYLQPRKSAGQLGADVYTRCVTGSLGAREG